MIPTTQMHNLPHLGPVMTDIKHLQQDVAYVRTHVEKLERMLAHQIRSDPAAKKAAKKLFEDTSDLAKLYLGFDEPSNQHTIVKKLGIDKSKVSRLVAILLRHDYLRKLPDGRYAWTDFHGLLDLERVATAAIKSQAAASKSASRPAGCDDLVTEGRDAAEVITDAGELSEG